MGAPCADDFRGHPGLSQPGPQFLEILGGRLFTHHDDFLQVIDAHAIVIGDHGRLDNMEEHHTTGVHLGESGRRIGDQLAGGRKIDRGEDRFHKRNLIWYWAKRHCFMRQPSGPFVMRRGTPTVEAGRDWQKRRLLRRRRCGFLTALLFGP
jgi:hypothetical protein